MECSVCYSLSKPAKVRLLQLRDSARAHCSACSLVGDAIDCYAERTAGIDRILENAITVSLRAVEPRKVDKVSQNDSLLAVSLAVEDGGADSIILNLQLFLAKDDASRWPVIDRVREVPFCLDPGTLRQFYESKSARCQLNHGERCRQPGSVPLPTRVIEIGSGSIKLIDTEGRSGKYSALSHCWGSRGGPLKTLSSNMNDRKKGIDMPVMSKVVGDAIEICRILSITYLWVDSLCIIQDDSSDWVRESANMAAIYANAALTISATSAAEEEAGIFRERPKPFVLRGEDDSGVPFRVHVREALSHPGFCGQFNNPDVDPGILSRHTVKEPDYSKVPLLKRAWCMQERFLSPKVLHFTSNEMILECATRLYCECMEIGRSSGDDGKLTRVRLDFQKIVATIEKEKRQAVHTNDRIATTVDADAPVIPSKNSNSDSQLKERMRTIIAHNAKTKTKNASLKVANRLAKSFLNPVHYTFMRHFFDDEYSGPYEFTELAQNASRIWREIVQEYTAKALTYDRDRLPASSGVARQLGPALGSYHAGHWERDWNSLLWYPAKATGRRNRGDSQAPSWSWASVEGTPVYFDALYGYLSFSLFTVNRWNTTCTVDGDPYGAVNARGSVEVSGYLNRARVIESCVDEDGEGYILRGDRGRTFTFTPDVVVEPAGHDVVRVGEVLSCFECGRHFYTCSIGLVLRKENARPSASWPLSREIYRRIGRYESMVPGCENVFESGDSNSSNGEAEKRKGRALLKSVWDLLHRSSWPYTITIV
ncbi:hypothetical protein MMC17_010025 [Xylographa soralifera]|nr:hypothetical protein [Xylographa soralifera]